MFENKNRYKKLMINAKRAINIFKYMDIPLTTNMMLLFSLLKEK